MYAIRSYYDEMVDVLSPVAKGLEIDFSKKPFVIMMVGVNGSGKTTSIGKMASKYAGKKIGIVAGDTFRAAATEQLKNWVDKTKAKFYAAEEGADSAALCYSAYEQAVKDNLRNNFV